MAKRNRVPRRKSLGAGRRSRNKNPKLSPFQREQKRNRLANQPPTLASAVHRDYPASQRRIYEYLQQREVRDAARREARKRQREEDAVAAANREEGDADASPVVPPSSSSQDQKPNDAEVPTATERKAQTLRKTKATVLPSLNDDVKARTAPLEDRIDVRRLAKKEKKHAKRLQQRKLRIVENMQQLESEFAQSMTRKRGKGKDGDDVRAKDKEFERELLRMQRKNNEALKQGELEASKKRRLETNAAVAAAAAGKHEERPSATSAPPTKPPRDFYDYVDVVRFGERVEAPPVFDVVPTASSSLAKLAAKLDTMTEDGGKRRAGPAARHGLLSGSGSGAAVAKGYAERRRLASLGLAPRIHETIHTDARRPSSVAESGNLRPQSSSSSDEFARLRQRVMESYQRNKMLRHEANRPRRVGRNDPDGGRGGGSVDLKHQFPLI